MRSRHCQDVIKMRSKRLQDVVKMWLRHDQDANKMRSRCNQCIVKTWFRRGQDVVKMLSRCGQDAVALWSVTAVHIFCSKKKATKLRAVFASNCKDLLSDFEEPQWYLNFGFFVLRFFNQHFYQLLISTNRHTLYQQPVIWVVGTLRISINDAFE